MRICQNKRRCQLLCIHLRQMLHLSVTHLFMHVAIFLVNLISLLGKLPIWLKWENVSAKIMTIKYRCRSRQFLGITNHILPRFPQIARKKTFMRQTFHKFSVAVGTFYIPLPCGRRLENNICGTKNLIFKSPTESKYAKLCKNIVRSQLASCSEHLLHNSEIWRSIHIPTVAVSKTPHAYLKTYMQQAKHCIA